MLSYILPIPAPLRLPFRVSVVAYGLFIIWASLTPSSSTESIPHMDKLLHFLVYGFLSGGLILAWPQLSKQRVIVGCIALGVALEFGQGLMRAGRTASLWDGLANSLGAVLGVYAVTVLLRLIAR